MRRDGLFVVRDLFHRFTRNKQVSGSKLLAGFSCVLEPLARIFD
jgi:hypothetical protein